jgi:hypothetical protein
VNHFKPQYAALLLVLLWGTSVPILAPRFGISALVIGSAGVGLFVGAVLLPWSRRRVRSSSPNTEDAPIATPPIWLVITLVAVALVALATAVSLAR